PSAGSGRFFAAGGVAAEEARQRELAELVANHVLGHVDRHVAAAVVHGNGVADHLREDRRITRPGAQDLLASAGVHRHDALHQFRVHERALLQASTHLVRFLTMNLSVALRWRVFLPIAILPHFVWGWPPIGALPSPPPWGWSRGFMAEPRP